MRWTRLPRARPARCGWPPPQPTEEAEQRLVESAASLLRLRRVRDSYWDDD
ncbi:hypothetical protein [Streptomyces sp. NPDC127197]|uniref:hypothetical protein n=1 Tax=Streptomyces sp. NPDC127197 TaxID=3345388 RepID=UPI003624B8B9